MLAVSAVLAALSLALHLRAEYAKASRQIYLFKPLTTVIIAIFAALPSGSASTRYQLAIMTGMLLSLAGDVFLMLPGDRFVAGLISFLAAHVAYIIAFTSEVALGARPLLLVPYAVAASGVVVFLWPRLGRLRAPVIVYVSVIVLMAWQAAARASLLGTRAAMLAAIGAAFFVASDSVLAIRKFRAAVPHAQAIVMITYVLAQWLIAASVH
jgi:uncharacterized membrane protein YhhN